MAAPSAATGVTLLWLLLPTGLLALGHGAAADAAEVERVELEEAGLLGVSLLQSYGHLTQASVTASTRGSKTSLAGADQQSEHQQPTGSSTCGMTAGKPKVDCDKPDMGSCGNACCALDVHLGMSPRDAYDAAAGFLSSGGGDGAYSLVNGTMPYGEHPADDLTAMSMTWKYIFQGKHTTSGRGYVDTLDFNIRSDSPDSCVLRAFSISDIHGALGDAGQNYKTLAYMLKALGVDPAGAALLYGCGKPIAGTS
uniref:Uncharacterized protein n=1 Tax=Alexandrium catenella TaxID=2925 RepID=A0A7S1WXY9_ALECA|mmetsp:Transcript_9937/g.27047  ORF Transcript_9937/g.27047 Transcript_9937/m.27047 type:complete len:253 (+) Transcript_9937:87-845(+)